MPDKPTRTHLSALAQICEWIPPFLVAKLARKHGVDVKARAFSPWSHVIALLYAQLVHAISLNDICDGLRLHGTKLWRLRAATPPSRNGFSHANKVRPAAMAEELFWSVLNHLTSLRPRFGGRSYAGMPRRFKRLVHVVDASDEDHDNQVTAVTSILRELELGETPRIIAFNKCDRLKGGDSARRAESYGAIELSALHRETFSALLGAIERELWREGHSEARSG